MTRVRPLVAAAVLVVVAAGLLGWTVVERVLADRDRDDVTVSLATERARGAQAQAAVDRLRRDVAAVAPLTALPGSIDSVAALDAQSVSAIDAAVDAGLRGDITAYDSAVAKFDALNTSYAFALEVLRTQVNEAVVGLDPVSR